MKSWTHSLHRNLDLPNSTILWGQKREIMEEEEGRKCQSQGKDKERTKKEEEESRRARQLEVDPRLLRKKKINAQISVSVR